MKTRRPRQSADETRRQLIDAGVASLRESGLSIGLEAVNLEQAVRAADVPRSSAYAVWSGDEQVSPQVEFQRAVLFEIIEERRRKLQNLGESSIGVLSDLEGTLPRRDLFREVIRQTALSNTASAIMSVEWKVTIALRATLMSGPASARDGQLVKLLQDSANHLSDFTVATVYRPLADAFEIQPRELYGDNAYNLTEASVAAISEGISIRNLLERDEQLEDVSHPDGADGEWTLYSIMIEKVVETFFEPKSGTWENY